MTAPVANKDEIRQLRERLNTIEKTVAKIQEEVNTLKPLDTLSSTEEEPYVPADDPISEKDRVLAILRAKGLISEPTEYEFALAAKWNALSKEEKQEHEEYMDSLQIDPPLSQIIIDNRR